MFTTTREVLEFVRDNGPISDELINGLIEPSCFHQIQQELMENDCLEPVGFDDEGNFDNGTVLGHGGWQYLESDK